MTTNFELTSGKNRALVCYCKDVENTATFNDVINGVFEEQDIDVDECSDSSIYAWNLDEIPTSLNIALEYENVAKRLKVGGTFTNVCVGVFFYDQPAPPPEPEPDPDDPTELEEDDEPIPPPSITSLVCDALRETFGGVYGASAFVVPSEVTEFVLEVE